MYKPLPDAAALRAEFAYDPDTGEITRQSDGSPAFATVRYDGHRRGRWNGEFYQAHRIAWKLHYGSDPEYIDHINGDAGDNRIANLRSVTLSENQRNRGVQKNSASGLLGVAWSKRDKRWRVSLRIDGRRKQIGSFRSKEQAYQAWLEAKEAYGYHPNHGRRPAGAWA